MDIYSFISFNKFVQKFHNRILDEMLDQFDNTHFSDISFLDDISLDADNGILDGLEDPRDATFCHG